MNKTAEDYIRNEWDLLKKSGLLSQIGCSCGPKRERKGIYKMFEWNVLMTAPKNSPYSGYIFEFEIKFPSTYPEDPPKVYCKTKNIYHMNIRLSDGTVCISSITSKAKWKEFQNISTVLKSIFIMFVKPEPSSPYQSDIAQLYNSNREEYKKKVKEFCEANAKKLPE